MEYGTKDDQQVAVCQSCLKFVKLDPTLLHVDFAMMDKLLSNSSSMQSEPPATPPVSTDELVSLSCEKCNTPQQSPRCSSCGHTTSSPPSGGSGGSHRRRPKHPLHSQSMLVLRTSSEEDSSTTTTPSRAMDDYAFRMRSSHILRARAGAGNATGLAGRLSHYSRLVSFFVEASQVQGMDYPMCRDCARRTEKSLQGQVAEVARQTHSYRSALLELEKEHQSQHKESQSESVIEEEEEEEERILLEEVAFLREEKNRLQLQLEQWDRRRQRARALEDAYLEARNSLAHRTRREEDRAHGAVAGVEHASLHGQRLARTAVLNDVFHVWHEGHFACINGLRLGRLPSVAVDWTEVNGAWGLSSLLLRVLGQSTATQWTEWEPLPMGTCSQMSHRAQQGQRYDLNANYGDLSLTRLFWWRNFDTACAGFLSCVADLVNNVTRQDPSFLFPYVIQKDKIGPPNGTMLSVRYKAAEELLWTRALKYMLTTLKYVIAWVAKRKLDAEG